jgi:hypothetical protein
MLFDNPFAKTSPLLQNPCDSEMLVVGPNELLTACVSPTPHEQAGARAITRPHFAKVPEARVHRVAAFVRIRVEAD